MKGNIIDYLEEEFYIYEGCTTYRDINQCTYSNMHDLIKYSILNICGCVDKETYNFCVDVLNAADKSLSIQNIVENNLWETTEFIACFFDELGLIEHGGGIRGAWITELGKVVIDSLRHESLKFCSEKTYDLCVEILKEFSDVDGSCKFDAISELINDEIGTELLISIFCELGLLNKDISLTDDGEYILELGYEKKE